MRAALGFIYLGLAFMVLCICTRTFITNIPEVGMWFLQFGTGLGVGWTTIGLGALSYHYFSEDETH